MTIVVDQIGKPKAPKHWRTFDTLVVYVPEFEYILALKLFSGRPQDDRDILAIAQRLALSTKAAFFAATVEELCLRISFPCPPWTEQQTYRLETPWFSSSEVVQHDWLLATTPEPFRRRNIFFGGSVLDNKYELHHTFGSKPQWSIWSDQDLQNLAASDGVSSQ